MGATQPMRSSKVRRLGTSCDALVQTPPPCHSATLPPRHPATLPPRYPASPLATPPPCHPFATLALAAPTCRFWVTRFISLPSAISLRLVSSSRARTSTRSASTRSRSACVCRQRVSAACVRVCGAACAEGSVPAWGGMCQLQPPRRSLSEARGCGAVALPWHCRPTALRAPRRSAAAVRLSAP